MLAAVIAFVIALVLAAIAVGGFFVVRARRSGDRVRSAPGHDPVKSVSNVGYA